MDNLSLIHIYIFGFVTIKDGIKIHRTNCPNARLLYQKYGYRIVNAKWKEAKDQTSFQTTVRITGIDELGMAVSYTHLDVYKRQEAGSGIQQGLRPVCHQSGVEYSSRKGKVGLLADLLHYHRVVDTQSRAFARLDFGTQKQWVRVTPYYLSLIHISGRIAANDDFL